MKRLLAACSRAGNVSATELVAEALEREPPLTFIDVLSFEKLERRYLGDDDERLRLREALANGNVTGYFSREGRGVLRVSRLNQSDPTPPPTTRVARSPS